MKQTDMMVTNCKRNTYNNHFIFSLNSEILSELQKNVNPLFALDIFICSFHKCIQHTMRGQSNFPLLKL